MSWYFIRYTNEDTTHKEIASMLNQSYLISQEYSKRHKLHYHILWKTSLLRHEIKDLFYSFNPELPKGNPTLNIKECGEDLSTVGAYAVKDGNFIHTPEFDDVIDEYIKNSYRQDVPYTTAVKQLLNDYTTEVEYEKINWLRLKCEIAILRSRYQLEIYKSKIDALVLSVQISMNNNVAYELFSCD